MQLTHATLSRRRGDAGFTIVEVLVASTISMAALGAFLSFNRFQLYALRNQANQIDIQTTARSIVDLFAREVRRAGMNPNCAIPAFSGIAAAKSTSVRVQSDLNGDGALTALNEDLTYRYNFENNAVERVDHNGTTDTLVSGLNYNGSIIRYFDGAGAELIPFFWTGLTAAQRSAVRRIRIQLALVGTAVDPVSEQRLTAQAATDVDVRNRYFVNATACPGS